MTDSSGPRFRRHRRWISQIFNPQGVLQLRPLQSRETLVLLNGMVNEPENFINHFKR